MSSEEGCGAETSCLSRSQYATPLSFWFTLAKEASLLSSDMMGERGNLQRGVLSHASFWSKFQSRLPPSSTKQRRPSMAPKASKASASSQDIAPQLNVRERLLLAQVTYELGCKDWARIATLLSKHPLIDRPTGFYTPASCHSAYVTLMKEMDVDL